MRGGSSLAKTVQIYDLQWYLSAHYNAPSSTFSCLSANGGRGTFASLEGNRRGRLRLGRRGVARIVSELTLTPQMCPKAVHRHSPKGCYYG